MKGTMMKSTLTMMLLTSTIYASCATQTQFSTPEAAVEALYSTIQKSDEQGLTRMMGNTSREWLFSGDKVVDENNRHLFIEQYTQKHLLKKQNPKTYHLVIGTDEWPFAAPIIACKKTWSFDGNAGGEEILNRRVGANELDTIQTLLAIVDAQREYATGDLDGNRIHDYAQKLLSTKGKKDGLYWKSTENSDSPLGELVAAAAVEGYTKKSPTYHGYRFKILKAQGKGASDGAYSYMSGDKMIGGFAVLAYPAKYGSSGVMSFIVNHDGVVYQKDLGKRTTKTAPAIIEFNPDKGWDKLPQ